MDGAFAAQQLRPGIVHKPDADRVYADLGSATPYPQDQMRPRMHSWEPGDPYVLEDAQDRELALLVDERVVGDDREIDLQLRRPGSS